MTAKRWGKPFRDKRDWVPYNEQLVVRGEFLMDFEWVRSWDSELERMNAGKRGSPFLFPESLARLQGVWHQWVDFRGIEGITRKLAGYGIVPDYNDYTTISRRVAGIDTAIALPSKGSVCVACDGSGMKMTNAGEYRQTKYGKGSRKFIRVTITADPIKKKLLACDACVDGEGPSEQEIARKHVDEIIGSVIRIIKFWGDGSFDTHDMFNKLRRHAIESAIKIRKNASSASRGSMRRAREVKAYNKLGYRKWAEERRYGLRWAVEGVFSAVKRKFGENVRSRERENMLNESVRKFWAYASMKEYAEARVS